MIALYTIVIFFFLMILVYPAVCAFLSLAAWYRKRRIKTAGSQQQLAEGIDSQADQLKVKAFKITILLIFFAVAPFAAIVLLTNLF